MDNITLMVFFTILPIILLLVFVYNNDKSKEPISLLLQMFFLGMISSILVIWFSDTLRMFFPFMSKKLADKNFIEVILYAFVGVALTEEFCKWLMVYFRGYNNQEFDEVYDIIVYAVFVSLGFAFIENIIYVFYGGTLRTAILRAISSIPGHASDAVFMGYYLSLAKQFHYKNKKDLEKKYILLSIFVPALLHGIYDYCLMSKVGILIIVFIAFIIVLYINAFNTLKKVSLENRKLILEHNFCKHCGYKVKSDFCPRCGERQG
ncbi:MAG: PrsW family intramembrane metalloprotease [Bacilli bacterium]|nr:PrsW family intramembrane metalloprotease [Bacilli bacterium]